MTWEEVLRRIESRLSPQETAAFARLHRGFTAYPTEHTCRAFYDFAARHDLLTLLASHRFDRLASLLASLREHIAPQAPGPALDVGAGAGLLAAWLRDAAGFTVSAVDLSPAVAERLGAAGFAAPAPGATFDLVLCADSLGEINADEDDWLSDPAHADDPGFGDELEARYGFSHKLMPYKNLLKPGGVVLVYEPIGLAHFWAGAARHLQGAGWTAEVLGPDPTWGMRLGLKV